MRTVSIFALCLMSAAAMADPLSAQDPSMIAAGDEITIRTGSARYSAGGVLGFGSGIHQPGGAGTGFWGDPHVEMLQTTGPGYEAGPLSALEGDPDRPIISDRVR